jgi:hypothetical protein
MTQNLYYSVCRSDDICMLDRHAEGSAVPELGHAVPYLDRLVDSL